MDGHNDHRDAIMKTLNVVEAKSKFSDYLSRTASGERFIIQRRGRQVAALINIDELRQLDRSRALLRRLALGLGQTPDILEKIERGELHPAMAAFGLWSDEEDLADLDESIRTNRDTQPSRPSIEL